MADYSELRRLLYDLCNDLDAQALSRSDHYIQTATQANQLLAEYTPAEVSSALGNFDNGNDGTEAILRDLYLGPIV